MALTTQQDNGLVRAVALVGFFRNGDIVEPGQVLELSRRARHPPRLPCTSIVGLQG